MATSSKIICDDEFEIVRITEDLYDEAEELFYRNFIHFENVCIATNLLSSPKAISELKSLLRYVMDEGISFAVKQRATHKIVAICANTIVKPAEGITLDRLCKTFSSPEMINIGEYLHCMETTYDIYKEWQIDCCVDLEFIVSDHNFARRGLATLVTAHSLEFLRRMCHGTLTEAELQSISPNVRDMRPKAATAVFTTLYTQKLGEKLGFQSLNRISNKEFSYEGATYASRIDPIHEWSVYAGLRL